MTSPPGSGYPPPPYDPGSGEGTGDTGSWGQPATGGGETSAGAPTSPLPPFGQGGAMPSSYGMPGPGAPPPGQAPPAPFAAGMPQPPSPSRRRGPGWFAVIAIATITGLLGALTASAVAWALSDGTSTISTGGRTVDREEGSVASIAAAAVPSVVTIRVGTPTSGGTGTGWIYDDSGHVVTNNHVVEAADDGAPMVVETDSGERYEATLVGRDASYDLAVLDVKGLDRPALQVGSSSDVVVGDEVIAVGSPLGLSSTVTSGIVSALERPVTAGEAGSESYISAIQTDAAINPGNSGGPLLDATGRVVGVNSAIAQVPGQGRGGASGSIGVGFAIPSDVARRTVDQLIKTGSAEHPVIGVTLVQPGASGASEGAQVQRDGRGSGDEAVVPDGPAAKAGVRPGDLIVAMDGQRILSPDQLIVRIRSKAVGDRVTLTVRRGDDEKDLSMTLEAAPE